MAKRQKVISLILLLIMTLLAALAAVTSVSRYVFDREDVITGSFTNLYFSHNGSGRTVIMEEGASGYTGYLSLTAYNYDGGNISARDISYSVRLPSEGEIAAGQVVDAWGTPIKLDNADAAAATRNYTRVGFDSGKDSSTITAIGSDETLMPNETTDMLKIERSDSASAGSLTFDGESIYLIIEIVKPYRELRPFIINTSTSLVSVATSAIDTSDTHFDYPQYSVYVQTARHFSTAVENVDVASPVKIELSWSSSSPVIFDDGRFAADTADNIVRGEIPADDEEWDSVWNVTSSDGGVTVTLFLEQGSDALLYFYVTDPSSFGCTIKAWFHCNKGGVYSAEQYTLIAGAASDGKVLETGIS